MTHPPKSTSPRCARAHPGSLESVSMRGGATDLLGPAISGSKVGGFLLLQTPASGEVIGEDLISPQSNKVVIDLKLL